MITLFMKDGHIYIYDSFQFFAIEWPCMQELPIQKLINIGIYKYFNSFTDFSLQKSFTNSQICTLCTAQMYFMSFLPE